MPTASYEEPTSPPAFSRRQCPGCQHWVDYAPGEVSSATIASHGTAMSTSIRGVECPNCHGLIEISKTTRRTK